MQWLGVVRSLDAHATAVAQHPVMGIFAGTVQVGTGIGCTRNQADRTSHAGDAVQKAGRAMDQGKVSARSLLTTMLCQLMNDHPQAP